MVFEFKRAEEMSQEDLIAFIRANCEECHLDKDRDDELQEICLEDLKILSKTAPSYQDTDIEELQDTCRKCDYSQPYVQDALTPPEPANP